MNRWMSGWTDEWRKLQMEEGREVERGRMHFNYC